MIAPPAAWGYPAYPSPYYPAYTARDAYRAYSPVYAPPQPAWPSAYPGVPAATFYRQPAPDYPPLRPQPGPAAPIDIMPTAPPPNISEIGKLIRRKQRDGLSEAQKLQNARRQALALFHQYQDDVSGLMGHLRNWGVQVMDGNKTPWVDKALKAYGGGNVEALYLSPQSILYPDAPLPNVTRKDVPDMPPEYPDFINRLNVQRKPAILLPSGKPNLDTVYHETFHLFQTLNGLPWGTTVEVSDQAESRKGKLYQEISQGCLPGVPWSVFSLPWLKLKKRIGLIPDDPKGVGADIRTSMARELEAMQFMKDYGKALGTDENDQKTTAGRMASYDLVRKLSYRYDGEKVESKTPAVVAP